MSADYLALYTDFLRGAVDVVRPLRVVFDFSNGPTALVVPPVIEKNRLVNPTFVASELSGNFPAHGPNPLAPQAISSLQREVMLRRADLGAIFDADGDRALFVDHRGRWIPPYVIAHLLSLSEAPPYLFEPRTYFLLEKSGLLNQSKSEKTRVGTFFIKRRMRETDAGFAAESSGHYYFKEFFFSDSGVLAAVKVMNAVTRLPYTLASFYDLIPRRLVFAERNIEGVGLKTVVQAVLSQITERARKIDRTDGVLLDFGTWFVHVRPSNTEPLTRLFVASRETVALKKTIDGTVARLAGRRESARAIETPSP